jgi:hypothetical protein
MPVLLGLLLAASLTAQDRTFRIERGNATQEMQAGGLSAAHSIIPVGSKVRVTNPANGLDIEVTIIDRIPESSRRIIDLSPGAALALDLGPGGPVMVTPTSIAQATPSELRVGATPGTGTESEKQALPYNITINNYVSNPDKPAQTAPVTQAAPAPQAAPLDNYEEHPTRRNMTAYDGIEPEPSRYVEEVRENPYRDPEPPARQPVQAAQPAQPAASLPLYTSPPVYNIRIIPGLPDPHSGKVYRLFVGTYQGVDNAFHVYQQLQAAGFEVAQEQAGDMCRLFAAGIPASRVYYAAQRLGAIGFEQVWILE